MITTETLNKIKRRYTPKSVNHSYKGVIVSKIHNSYESERSKTIQQKKGKD